MTNPDYIAVPRELWEMMYGAHPCIGWADENCECSCFGCRIASCEPVAPKHLIEYWVETRPEHTADGPPLSEPPTC